MDQTTTETTETTQSLESSQTTSTPEAPSNPAPATTGDDEPRVPLSRLQQALDAKKAAEAKIAEYEAKVQSLTAAQTEAQTAAKTAAERLDLVRAGLDDDDGIEVARVLYGRLQDESKPATLAEWVASKPAKLSPFLGEASPTTPAPTKTSTGGAAPGGSPAGSLSPIDQLRSANDRLAKAIASGDKAAADAARVEQEAAKKAFGQRKS